MAAYDVCKICAQPAARFARLRSATVFPGAEGLAPDIDYARCGACGFLFSRFLDDWPAEQLERLVYHQGFHTHPEEPNLKGAQWLADLIEDKTTPVLDYGCGTGSFAEGLRAAGIAHVVCYDPYTERFRRRPAGRFSIVFAQEVLEHMTDPDAGLRDICSFLAPWGGFLFTTLVQPEDIETQREGWWYFAPAGGHVSLHTPQSLAILLGRHGLAYTQLAPFIHSARWQAPG